jgi:hypothetical protein
MTVKTQGGKVITKDGKVSCECCEEGACGCDTEIKEPLASLLRTSTTASCNGETIVFRDPGEEGSFNAVWFFEGTEVVTYTVFFSEFTNCLNINGSTTDGEDDGNLIFSVSNRSVCCPVFLAFPGVAECTDAGFFTLNGLQIPAVNIILEGREGRKLVPTATFVFS